MNKKYIFFFYYPSLSSSTVMAANLKQQLANLVNTGGAPKDLTEK